MDSVRHARAEFLIPSAPDNVVETNTLLPIQSQAFEVLPLGCGHLSEVEQRGKPYTILVVSLVSSCKTSFQMAKRVVDDDGFSASRAELVKCDWLFNGVSD